jgi:phage tail protein X
LFALAWLWDAQLGDELDAARERERSALGLEPTASRAELGSAAARSQPARTSAILIGRPAGAASQRATPPPPAKLNPTAPAPTALGPTTLDHAQAGAPHPLATQPDTNASPPPANAARWRVEPGQTLYSIVLKHYGRADAALVERVADHNGIARPEQLRAGHMLVLPAP